MRALSTIERNARSQAKLIEDLLDVSRMLSGTLRLSVEPVHVAAVIEQMVESIRLRPTQKTSSCKRCSTQPPPCSATSSGCSRSSATCCRTRSSSRRRAGRCRSPSNGSPRRSKFASPTPARASSRNFCRGSSSGSSKPTRRRLDVPADWASASRSSSTSWSCTGAPSRLSVRDRRRDRHSPSAFLSPLLRERPFPQFSRHRRGRFRVLRNSTEFVCSSSTMTSTRGNCCMSCSRAARRPCGWRILSRKAWRR